MSQRVMLLNAEACARWHVRHMTLSPLSGPFVDVTAEDLDSYLNGNLRGTYVTTQAVVRQMKKQSPNSVQLTKYQCYFTLNYSQW